MEITAEDRLLIKRYARRFADNGVIERDDLEQEAAMALHLAPDDAKEPAHRFSYVRRRISGAMIDFIRWQMELRYRNKPQFVRLDSEEGAMEFEDTMTPELELENKQLQADFSAAAEELNPRQRELLDTLIDGTYGARRELADRWGVTQGRVCQIKYEVERKLRSSLIHHSTR